jgi:bacterioferritin-associated ferredoxin
MYVCLCKGITDSQIKDAIYDGATSVRQLRKKLGVASQCGKCTSMTQQIVHDTLSLTSDNNHQDLYYAAS